MTTLEAELAMIRRRHDEIAAQCGHPKPRVPGQRRRKGVNR